MVISKTISTLPQPLDAHHFFKSDIDYEYWITKRYTGHPFDCD